MVVQYPYIQSEGGCMKGSRTLGIRVQCVFFFPCNRSSPFGLCSYTSFVRPHPSLTHILRSPRPHFNPSIPRPIFVLSAHLHLHLHPHSPFIFLSVCCALRTLYLCILPSLRFALPVLYSHYTLIAFIPSRCALVLRPPRCVLHALCPPRFVPSCCALFVFCLFVLYTSTLTLGVVHSMYTLLLISSSYFHRLFNHIYILDAGEVVQLDAVYDDARTGC